MPQVVEVEIHDPEILAGPGEGRTGGFMVEREDPLIPVRAHGALRLNQRNRVIARHLQQRNPLIVADLFAGSFRSRIVSIFVRAA